MRGRPARKVGQPRRRRAVTPQAPRARRPAPTRRRAPFWLPLAVLLVASGLGVLAFDFWPAPTGIAVSRDFAVCRGRGQPTCVVDGDTIRYRGERIRLLDIDTPEIFSPQCASEREWGRRAMYRLVELLNQGSFEIVAGFGNDRDVYGRQLRRLVRNGNSLGDMLVEEGLARRWTGMRGGWCG
ncbi:nuclease [Afifella sp. IM 167]|nr:thermonuclease family protein [Afifella sp. IM 167]MBZ8134746.1 nuclease [Afifella sp. IM 167]